MESEGVGGGIENLLIEACVVLRFCPLFSVAMSPWSRSPLTVSSSSPELSKLETRPAHLLCWFHDQGLASAERPHLPVVFIPSWSS